MLQQSIVSFKIKSKNGVKRWKNTFRLIGAACFITFIVYLIIHKSEQDIFKRIFDRVCIQYPSISGSLLLFFCSKAIILNNECEEDIKIKSTSFIAAVVEIDVTPPTKCQRVKRQRKQ